MAAPETPVEQVRDLERSGLRGWNFQSQFGRRTNISVNTTADIWSGTAAIRPLVQSGTVSMAIKSASAQDQYLASGAQFVGVSFIDGAGDWRMSDLVPVLGTSPSAVTYQPDNALNTDGGSFTVPGPSSVLAPIFRVQDMAVIVALGATQAAPRAANIGKISLVDLATGLVEYEAIPAGLGRSSAASFHCPRGYRGRLTYAPVGSSTGTGTFFIAVTFGLGTAFQVLPLATVSSNSALFRGDPMCTPILPGADVQTLISVTANNTDATAMLQIRLEPA